MPAEYDRERGGAEQNNYERTGPVTHSVCLQCVSHSALVAAALVPAHAAAAIRPASMSSRKAEIRKYSNRLDGWLRSLLFLQQQQFNRRSFSTFETDNPKCAVVYSVLNKTMFLVLVQ